MVPGQQHTHWKDRAIKKSEVISDAWEVTKIYAGRIAEWILFLCMVINIMEILPSLSVPLWFSNVVLGVQAVTLDVAGFGLASMADQAQSSGHKKEANVANLTAWFLIGLMIVTLLLVSIGLLFPTTKSITDLAEKGLILVRVVMTVIYGHVVHSLRHVITDIPSQSATQVTPSQVAPSVNSQKTEYTIKPARISTQSFIITASNTLTPQAAFDTIGEDEIVSLEMTLFDHSEEPVLETESVPELSTPVAINLAPLSDTFVDTEEEEVVDTETLHRVSPPVDNIVPFQRTTRVRKTQPLPEYHGGQRNTDKLTSVDKKGTTSPRGKSASSGMTENEKRIRRYIKNYPDWSAEKIAQKANVSRSYVNKIKTKMDTELVVGAAK